MFRLSSALRVLGAFLLVTGLVVCVGAAGLYWYLVPKLPPTDSLKDVQLQEPLRVYSRHNRLIAEFGEKRRTPLEFEQIPQRMVQAVLAAEDERFYQHPGVDWQGLTRAVVHVIRTAQDCIALVDEAYLLYHSRQSSAATSRDMSQQLNLSRQRNQTLLFVSQEARQVDKNIVSSASVLVFKDLGMLQPDFDRPELRKLVIQAKEAMDTYRADKKHLAYVYSPDADHLGMLTNQLPSFWKPSLSRIFSTEPTSQASRPGVKTSAQDRAKRAKELRKKGYSYRQIASELGVTKGTVANYLKGYPYK